jgi:hypothetical protein
MGRCEDGRIKRRKTRMVMVTVAMVVGVLMTAVMLVMTVCR